MSHPMTSVLLDPGLLARLEAELRARLLRGERATKASIIREALDELLPPAPAPVDERQISLSLPTEETSDV